MSPRVSIFIIVLSHLPYCVSILFLTVANYLRNTEEDRLFLAHDVSVHGSIITVPGEARHPDEKDVVKQLRLHAW